MHKRRVQHEVQAGSMADIAFLLLIFFLVATTIQSDQGIMVKLPPWDPYHITVPLAHQNVLTVWVNARDELLVRGNRMHIDELSDHIKLFVLNPNQSKEMADKPTKAVVSLKSDRTTSYATYIEVYDQIKTAYHEMWDAESQKLYDRPYTDELTSIQKKVIRSKIPLLISEAEPSDFGKIAADE